MPQAVQLPSVSDNMALSFLSLHFGFQNVPLQEASRVRPEGYQSVLLQAQLYVSLGNARRANESSQEGV